MSDQPLTLVVDDSRLIREVIKSSLRGAGFRVEEAVDGPSGVEAYERLRPDLVLLDVVMPGFDGFEACAAMRALPSGADTAIVIMTTLEDVGAIDRAYDCGATDFVLKPLNLPLLLHRLRYLLRSSRAMADLRTSEQRLARAHRIAGLGNWEWITSEDRIELSTDLCRVFGLAEAPQSVSVAELTQRVHPADRERVARAFGTAERTSQLVPLEHVILRPDGAERIVRQEAELSVESTAGEPRLTGTVLDVTDIRRAEREIRRLAYHDGLTGLPNRTYLSEHLVRVVAEARRHCHPVAIMALDLDLFKRINDTFGHAAGDDLLRQVARRLNGVLRESDLLSRPQPASEPTAETDTIVRYGGDEFIVVITRLGLVDQAGGVAMRLIDRMSEPFELATEAGTVEAFVTCSIGIATYPDNGEDVETLLRNADAAMYDAKSRGRGVFQFYSDEINARVRGRFAIETELREAHGRGELELHYQPLVNPETNTVQGTEALLRWRHPRGDTVGPHVFIPILEETGMIVEVGQWVLHNACAQTVAWQTRCPGLRVAVNVSARQIIDASFLDAVQQVLTQTGIRAEQLELEITESILLEEAHRAGKVLAALRALGVRVALDDFGTGYSSLSYLKRYEIDTLKIDRSFVSDIATDSHSAAIASAMIALCAKLGLAVVCEGVETEQQKEFLIGCGCSIFQGFLFGRPMPPERFEAWLGSWPL